jgi:hypothetical protein
MLAVSKPARRLTAALVASALAASALVPAAAGARVWDSDYLPIYTLTKDQKKSVCGSFTGTMLYPDGYRVDCATGDVYYAAPPTS